MVYSAPFYFVFISVLIFMYISCTTHKVFCIFTISDISEYSKLADIYTTLKVEFKSLCCCWDCSLAPTLCSRGVYNDWTHTLALASYQGTCEEKDSSLGKSFIAESLRFNMLGDSVICCRWSLVFHLGTLFDTDVLLFRIDEMRQWQGTMPRF